MSAPRVLHRRPGTTTPALTGYGWRARPWAALVWLRPPVADHTRAEADAIADLARGQRLAVEIGVAEGASARWIRDALDEDGVLVCIDPYRGGVLNRSIAELVARRLLGRRGAVEWLRQTGQEASPGWPSGRLIDLLVIDGVHQFEPTRAEWEAWTPHVRDGGHVVVRLQPTNPVNELRFVDWVRSQPGWSVVDELDDFAIVRRGGS